ncbi:MAG: transcriptional regulator NrdR [Candidatus Saccharibacteria bacterium]|nr:transcriptional regulator NrdR [Candidatus Saccharibacteria bacterium]
MGSRDYRIGDSKVLESREVGDGKTIRRRRETLDGKYRFTTYERIERPNLAVVKKNGQRELFDREKLAGAIKQSVGKFFASELEVEQIIDAIEDAIYGLGDLEVSSRTIGDSVLDILADRNEVAYVRFASVYHDFKTLDEFEAILASRRRLNQEKGDVSA